MPTILDQHGQPISSTEFAEPQTARLAQLRSEYDNHPTRGLTPARLAAILERAERGDITQQHELFADLEEKDGHLFSVMQTRRMALQTLEWSIVVDEDATPQEKSHADYLRDVLPELADFEDLVFDMTDAIGHGFSAMELEWKPVERQLLPVKATHRPQGWFKYSVMPGADRNELRLRDNSAEGEALWPFGWLLHTHRARSGYLSRAGLFRVLCWPFVFKNFAVRDLAEFLEIYGLPLRLGTYGPAATEKDKATLLKAVVNIGHDAAAIIPQGMMIDFQSAAQGDNKSYDAMIGLMERTMSKAILGGTLTSGEGEHGTQALGSVHNELRHDLKHGDARQVGATLTRNLLYPILATNMGLDNMRRCPRLVFDTQEPEDVTMYAEAVPKLVSMGMRIKRSWAHTKLKIPEAGDADEILTAASANPAQERPPAANDAVPPGRPRLVRMKAQAAVDAEPLDDLAAAMLDEWQDEMGELAAPVRAALASAATFEQFQAALEEGLATVETERLVELLARGQFAARVWGNLDQPKRPDA